MKKVLILSLCVPLLFTGCDTYSGMGAYAGGSFGSIIGSAIGGLSGGHRGSDIGTLIGMAGGAAVGAAVGAAADNARHRDYEEYQAARAQRRHSDDYGNYRSDRTRTETKSSDESGFDANGKGDDRLIGFDENFNSTVQSISCDLEIRSPRLVDVSRDGVLTRGEEARMIFEIYNKSDKPAYHVLPSVSEITGNRHIHISENVLVESIMPGKGIRYTAVIKADNRLKDGEAVIRISVLQGNKEIASQTQDFPLQTSKR